MVASGGQRAWSRLSRVWTRTSGRPGVDDGVTGVDHGLAADDNGRSGPAVQVGAAAAPGAELPGGVPVGRPEKHRDADPDHAVPWLLRVAAGWSWRVLLVCAAIWLVVLIVIQLRVLALALMAALLVAALVYPFCRVLRRIGLGRAGAAVATLLFLVLGFAGMVAFVSATTVAEWPELRQTVNDGVGQIRDWLVDGPLGLDANRLDNLGDDITKQAEQNRERLTSGAITGATLLIEVVGGILIGLFATFFFLYDGHRLWHWIARLFPVSAQDRVHSAGHVAWQTLTGYIRGTIFVALVDAVFIGLGLFLVGVPLVAPLAVLTFFGAFIPIAGAAITGILAVLVALVAKGPVAALIIAGVVLGVQQVEGHVLQPLVLGKSVQLHPLAIVLTITAGATLAGVAGAVVAVPLVAVLNRVAVHLSRLNREGVDPAADDVDAEAGYLADDPGPD